MRPLAYVNAGLECTASRTVGWNDVVVECILDVTCLILASIQSMEVGIVLSEDQLRFHRISVVDSLGVSGVDGGWGRKAV